MTSTARELYRAGPPRWELPEAVDPAEVRALADALRLPIPLARILVARGTGEPEAAKRFLRPLLDRLPQPGSLRDLTAAADRIYVAIEGGETILVHGDYDVDGVCAAALLTRWIRRLGGQVEAFAPHRLHHGYDLGEGGISRARDLGAALIVTVDCGIVAHDAVRAAGEAGIEVIVTDHHTPSDELPDALAVVNPNRVDDDSGCESLCGAGVAFQLCRELAGRRGHAIDALAPDLDLVALATIADLVPLREVNRTLVRYGLRAMARTEKVGLRALLEVCGVSGEPEAGRVAFQVAPRINAVGRIGDAADALRLLLTDDPGEAERLALHLDETNAQRKEEDQRTLEAAFETLREEFDPDRDYGVVVAGDGWHPGVIGIVASRVVERIHRPVVLVALDGASGRGSGRSIPGFDLFGAIAANAEFLGRFGGHRQAAGMDVTADALDGFRAGFNASCRAELEGQELRPTLRADTELSPSEATLELAEMGRYLGPHGIGNSRPVLWARNVEVRSAREVGRGHLRVELRDADGGCAGIGFGLAERIDPDTIVGERVDALYQLKVNEYRGARSPQMNLLDLRRADGTPLQPPASTATADR